MSNFLENNYNLINRILAVTIIGSLAVAGGAWFINNKDWSFPSPVKWVTDKAVNSDPGLPKMEPIKIEPIKPIELNDLSKFTPAKSGSTSTNVGKPSPIKTDVKGKR
jgi:hypothetical protein